MITSGQSIPRTKDLFGYRIQIKFALKLRVSSSSIHYFWSQARHGAGGAFEVSGLLGGYTGIWPREVIEEPDLFEEVKGKLGQPGVYVLYRNDLPYYVGQAKGRIYRRLRSHARVGRGRRGHFWNFFSAFLIDKEHVDELEAMLIAALPSASNASKPKIAPISLSSEARKQLKAVRLRRSGLSEDQIRKATGISDEDDADDNEDSNAD